MTPDLPADPREREIFLRALREYSERCEAPELTADCPYSHDTRDPGVRGCGEECMDILGKYEAPRPTDTPLGGYVGRPRLPRPRRQQSSPAYDARQIYLEDEASGPPRRWRLAAILVDLKDSLRRPPPSDPTEAKARLEHVRRLINLTEGRGLDFQDHLLPYLRRVVVGRAVFVQLLMSTRSTSLEFDRANGWSRFVDTCFDSAIQPQHNDATNLHLATQAWALTASLEDLLEWVPPDPPYLREPPSIPVTEAEKDGVWVFDRFTATYLADWSSPSLRKEWLYLHGQYPAPCLSLEMRVRQIPQDKLAAEMADRFSRPKRAHHLANSMVTPAVDFLEEGRRVEAAALFEAAVRIDPNDPDALNNLGFCLLPDRPKRALELFDKAIETGFRDIDVTNANRMLALVILGRWTSALDLATADIRRYADSEAPVALVLWDIDSVIEGGDPRLLKHPNLLTYAEGIETLIERRRSTVQGLGRDFGFTSDVERNEGGQIES